MLLTIAHGRLMSVEANGRFASARDRSTFSMHLSADRTGTSGSIFPWRASEFLVPRWDHRCIQDKVDGLHTDN